MKQVKFLKKNTNLCLCQVLFDLISTIPVKWLNIGDFNLSSRNFENFRITSSGLTKKITQKARNFRTFLDF